jgi:hypothetical protein
MIAQPRLFLLFAAVLASTGACYVVTEKPADSTPPAGQVPPVAATTPVQPVTAPTAAPATPAPTATPTPVARPVRMKEAPHPPAVDAGVASP